MSREEEFTHEGFVYANNIYMERKCELFEVKDIAHDFVQGAIYADQHPRKGLWDAEKVCKWLNDRIGINQKIEIDSDGEPLADSYIAYCIARQNAADTMIKDLRKAMEE